MVPLQLACLEAERDSFAYTPILCKSNVYYVYFVYHVGENMRDVIKKDLQCHSRTC